MVSHLRSHTLLFHLVILMVLGNCQTHNSFLQSNLLSDFHFSVSLHEAYKKECLENIQNPEKKANSGKYDNRSGKYDNRS